MPPVRPPAPRPVAVATAPAASGRSLPYAAMAAVAVVVVVAGLLFALRSRTGELIVNVSGPGGVAVENVKVLVDDQVRCTESPCPVSDLAAGQHSLHIIAEGFQPPAKRIVGVSAGEAENVDIELVPLATAKGTDDSTAKKAEPSAEDEEEEIPTLELGGDDRASPKSTETTESAPRPVAAAAPRRPTTPAAAPRTPAPAAPPARATGQGRISINSIPVSNVVVDGRPLGQTPTSISVPPGAHRVMFIHPEKGRRIIPVQVQAGQTAVAAVRF